jgi:hypothetical protein
MELTYILHVLDIDSTVFLLRERDVRQILPEWHRLVLLFLLTGRLGLLSVNLGGVGDEGDNGVLPEGEVDDREDVDEHEGEDQEADQHVGVLGQRVVDEPPHEARAQEVHVDADDHQPEQPREHDDLQTHTFNNIVTTLLFNMW